MSYITRQLQYIGNVCGEVKISRAFFDADVMNWFVTYMNTSLFKLSYEVLMK